MSDHILRPAWFKTYQKLGRPCGQIVFSDGSVSREFFTRLAGLIEIFDAVVNNLIVYEESTVLADQLGQSALPLDAFPEVIAEVMEALVEEEFGMDRKPSRAHQQAWLN